MNTMDLVDSLTAQVMDMIPAFERQHGCTPTVVFMNPTQARAVYEEMAGCKLSPDMLSGLKVWLAGLLVLANATVNVLELAAIALPRDWQPTAEEAAPLH